MHHAVAINYARSIAYPVGVWPSLLYHLSDSIQFHGFHGAALSHG